MPTLDETKNCSIEGFGISYLEAAFFAIPSIASNVGGTPEAVINNTTGKIINNIDELYPLIRELLINEKQRLVFGQNAQKRAVAEFTWSFISRSSSIRASNRSLSTSDSVRPTDVPSTV